MHICLKNKYAFLLSYTAVDCVQPTSLLFQ